jgi:hypothetical protein
MHYHSFFSAQNTYYNEFLKQMYQEQSLENVEPTNKTNRYKFIFFSKILFYNKGIS